jgi:hypothetical protein
MRCSNPVPLAAALAACLTQGWPPKHRHSKQLGIPFGRGIGATNGHFADHESDMGILRSLYHHATDPSAAWPLASEAIVKATGCPAKCVKTFLDSSQGRVFADGVIELMSPYALETAVDAVVKKWMHCKIIPKDESDYGIKADRPYLPGFACHCKLEADTGEGRAHRPQPFV